MFDWISVVAEIGRLEFFANFGVSVRSEIITPSNKRGRFGRDLASPGDPHRHARNSPDDGGIARIANLASMYGTVGRRNENQLSPIQLVPTANVAIPEFEEEDWAVKLVMPLGWSDCSLAGVDLYERTGSDDWVESLVFHSDITVKRIAAIGLLE